MPEKMDSNNPQENLDYQHALEVIREVSEAMINALGQEAVEQASFITYESGVIAPQEVIGEAEHIKHLYGVAEPKAVVQEAEEIIVHNTEVASVGEELKVDEEVDETVANEASVVLHNHYVSEAYRQSANNRSAHKYMYDKAATEAQRHRINQHVQDQFKKGNDK